MIIQGYFLFLREKPLLLLIEEVLFFNILHSEWAKLYRVLPTGVQ